MNYTLHQLQVFLKIVETKSISKAANELFLTQPAVSIQFKNFQNQFDIPLIDIIGKKVYVTEFGNEIAKMAERIINEVYAINYKTLAYKGILSGRLKLAIVSTGKYIMPYFLSDFLKQNKGIDLSMDVTNKSKVLESLENNEVDLALVSLLPEHLSVSEEIIMSNKLYLIGNLDQEFDAITNQKNIFETIPLIYREPGSGTRLIMQSFFEERKLNIKKRIELTSNEAVKQAVIAGLGCSIMPLIGIQNEIINKSLKIIPIEGLPITTNWRLIWLKNKRVSPVAQSFLEYTKTHKAKIIEKNFSWLNQV
jgi:DNA-binding transcriptional LysR family regulator